MKQLFGIILLYLTLLSCNSGSDIEKQIAQIPISVEVIRFDKAFASAEENDLPLLKQRFPLFFPEEFQDSIWKQKIVDTLQNELDEAVLKEFPTEAPLEEDLKKLFQHITYYFPEFEVPSVYTTTSDVDYRTRIIANDSLLILELDNYLGEDHLFYSGIPKYIVKNLKPSRLLPDISATYTRKYIAPPRDRTLLGELIYFGKELYLKDLWLPETSDALKIGYTDEELQWAEENEEEMWRYFIENELLYSTNSKLGQRFIDPAPFSKFNLEIDNESPGMIGRWLGWQMVRSYMENNAVSIGHLMQADAVEIFNNSQYKPKK
jgi:gliding motility-associated lipoprotein GldB